MSEEVTIIGAIGALFGIIGLLSIFALMGVLLLLLNEKYEQHFEKSFTVVVLVIMVGLGGYVVSLFVEALA